MNVLKITDCLIYFDTTESTYESAWDALQDALDAAGVMIIGGRDGTLTDENGTEIAE